MKKRLYMSICLILMGIQLLFPSQLMAEVLPPEISTQFIKINKKRISRSVYEYTFKVTLINHDIAIKDVTATVRSSSPHTIIMQDNEVSFDNVSSNDLTVSTDTFVLRQDRTQTFDPNDLTWKINYHPDMPFFSGDTNVNIIVMDSGGQITLDDSGYISFVVDFSSTSLFNTPYTVQITQDITPETGLTLTPPLDGSTFPSTEVDYKRFGQRVKVTQAGDYRIKTVATVIETGETTSAIMEYKVLPSGAPNLFTGGTGYQFSDDHLRRYLRTNTLNTISFSQNFSGKDYYNVTGIRLISPELELDLILNDAGEGDDDKAGDYVYNTHWFEIDTQGMPTGKCLTFYTVISTTKGDAESDTTIICVTGLPMGTFQTEEQYWVRTGGVPYARDTLEAVINAGTPESRIFEIAASVDAQVVAGFLMDGEYHMTIQLNDIPSESEALDVLLQKIEQLKSFPEVQSAGRQLGLISVLGDFPNDFWYQAYAAASSITQARADEAWYVVRGQANIAVLDTGIDEMHEDLAGKILPGGKNYAEKNNAADISDQVHHGTHVAGIAAAVSHNDRGIASVSWDSKILVFKMYEQDKGSGLKPRHLDRALYDLIKNRSIKIIDISSGFSVPDLSDECIAEEKLTAEYSKECKNQIAARDEAIAGAGSICARINALVAKNKIVIAAAGNSYSSTRVYPAACENAIAVGGVEPGKSFGSTIHPDPWFGSIFPNKNSNYVGTQRGGWVTLAAPAGNVLSTVPPETCFNEFFDYITQPFQPCVDSTNGYQMFSGTSQAAPIVAGAVAVILARHPKFLVKDVKDRLTKSAFSMDEQGLGAGALNIFDAVFNGDFELVKEGTTQPEEWERYIDTTEPEPIPPFAPPSMACESKQEVLELFPVPDIIDDEHNKRMLVCDNTDAVTASTMNTLDIPDGVTELPISFDWRMMAEDLKESGFPGGNVLSCGFEYVTYYLPSFPYIITRYEYVCRYKFMLRNDYVLVQLIEDVEAGKITEVFKQTLTGLDKSSLSRISSNNWLGNDWQHFSGTVPVTPGKYKLRIQLIHAGFASFEGNAPVSQEGVTLFMMDQLRFRVD